MSKRILIGPVISQHVRCMGRLERKFPFDTPGASFWWGGRAAIWQGVQALGLRPGDRVLVPAYCCGVEVSALLKAGLDLVYYHVGPDLTVDLEHLAALCLRAPRAIFVIHYLGFAQPVRAIAELARVHGAALIEDCAHALYAEDAAGETLGRIGDAAVFSLRKSLPVPNGGVLVLAPGARHPARPPFDRAAVVAHAHAYKDMVYYEAARHWPELVARIRASRNRGPVSVPSRQAVAFSELREAGLQAFREFDPARGAWPMSRLSRLLVRLTDARKIVTRRRSNYRLLLQRIEPTSLLRPLLPHLPRGASPWLFPVWVEDRDSLWRYLAANGVESYRFWRFGHASVPVEEFEHEARLRHHVLALPVHQDLRAHEANQIADLVNTWACRHVGQVRSVLAARV